MQGRDVLGERGEPLLLHPPGRRIDQKRGADLHHDAAEVGERRSFGHGCRVMVAKSSLQNHGCQAGARTAARGSAVARAASMTARRARSTCGTPAPVAAEMSSGEVLAARFRRASWRLISSAERASALL